MSRRVRMAGFGGALGALLVPMLALERRMQRAGGPGIIVFELAGTPEKARSIMDAWGEDGRAAARSSLLLDYPFLVAYTGLNVAIAGWAGDAVGGGRAVAAAQVAAGACDAVENAALLGVLGGGSDRLPAVARAFASAKFALLAVGSAHLVAAVAARRR